MSKLEGDKILPRLSIPEQFRTGVAALAALPEDSFVRLFEAVESGIAADTADSLASQIKPPIPSISLPELSKLFTTITALQRIQNNSHVSSETFASDISEALYVDSPALADGIDRELLKSRVSKIVTAKDILITSLKVREVQMEVERSFCKARIMTDIRAAFSEDAAEVPRGMTILHTLQIGYHKGSEKHQEFYVTLDDDDLASLKKVIERAEKKKSTLKEMLAKTECRLFE